MTFSGLKAAGRGKLHLRLMFEGWPYEFVTHADMERTYNNGRQRIRGLKSEGLSLEEIVDLPRAEMEAAGMVATIVDRQHDAAITKALAWRPSVVTYLDGDVTRTATTLDVLSSTGIVTDTVIHVGTEAMHVTNVTSNTLTVTRAYWDTIAQAHYADARGDLTPQPVTADRPYTLEGRRAYLYGYGEGDSLTGSGTILWRGVAATDAKLTEGSTWTVGCDSIWQLLKQDLGADLDEPVTPRGVYYSATAPLVLAFGEGSTTSRVTDAAFTVFNVPNDTGTAFFRDNNALVEHLNTEIASRVTTLNNSYRAVASPGGDDWWLECTVAAGGSERYPVFGFRSRVDGGNGNAAGYFGGGRIGTIRYNDGTTIGPSVTANDVVRTVAGDGVPGARSVPRGYWSRNNPEGQGRVRYYAGSTAADETSYPPNRLYLAAGLVVDTSLDGVSLEFASGRNVSVPITSVDATNRFIVTDRYRTPTDPADDSQFAYTRDWPLEVRMRRHYAVGDLDDFRDALVSTTDGSPVYANMGAFPFVTDSDLGDWQAVVDEAHGGRPWAAQRSYYAHEGVELGEMLVHECRLLGVFPHFNSIAKIDLARLRIPAPTEVPTATVTEAEQLGFAVWERNAQGSINTVLVRTGYNPSEGEHEGITYTIRDVAAYAQRKAPRMLEIAPMSDLTAAAVARGPIPIADLVELARPITGIFGGDYAVVTVTVPFTHLDTLVGDVVGLTLDNVPDLNGGTRGVDSINGLVTGRVRELDTGRVVLHVLVSARNIGGYSTSVWLDNFVNTAGNTWTADVNTTDPLGLLSWFASGEDVTDHLTIGDEIVVYRWDDATTGELAGQVDAVSATSLTLKFDGAFTPSTFDWVLRFDVAGQAETGQRAYAWLAGTDGRIDFATAANAQEYAP